MAEFKNQRTIRVTDVRWNLGNLAEKRYTLLCAHSQMALYANYTGHIRIFSSKL